MTLGKKDPLVKKCKAEPQWAAKQIRALQAKIRELEQKLRTEATEIARCKQRIRVLEDALHCWFQIAGRRLRP